MGLISWIIFGALAGWVANMLIGGNERKGCIFNTLIGVLGALLGGFIVEFFTGEGISFGFTFKSFGVAILGAVLLLAIIGNRK
ncbi:MAG: GlsB/YeaQ/YmgE family stress response membrane protein [Calditrichia bacterium]